MGAGQWRGGTGQRASLVRAVPVLGLLALILLAGWGGIAPLQAAEAKRPPQGKAQPRLKPQPAPLQPAPPQTVAPAQSGAADSAAGAAVAGTPAPATVPVMPRETVEADVSSRSVALTSAFAGTEIVVFGTVNASRQETAESGYYDVVVVLEGAPESLMARKKSNVGGIWLNTSALQIDEVPSFDAILATRPLDEIAAGDVLAAAGIGLQHTRAMLSDKAVARLPAPDIAAWKEGLIRLKTREGLYVTQDYAVVFIGRSLFRAAVELPANVPAGPLAARVYLFHEGEKLAEVTAHVSIERQGFERILYAFAFSYPFAYGLAAVAVAVAAGLAASALFRRVAA